jgi:hypothetical protein
MGEIGQSDVDKLLTKPIVINDHDVWSPSQGQEDPYRYPRNLISGYVYNVAYTYTFRGGLNIFPLRRTPLEVSDVTVLVMLVINSLLYFILTKLIWKCSKR